MRDGDELQNNRRLPRTVNSPTAAGRVKLRKCASHGSSSGPPLWIVSSINQHKETRYPTH